MSIVAAVGALPESVQNLIPYIATTAALWVAWRVWRFTIAPALNPDSPKPLPYLVPGESQTLHRRKAIFFLTPLVVGHVVGMSKNAGKVFTYGREYFGNTREIFSLTVMGEEMYIVTSPADVLAVYKESTKIDFDAIVKGIMGDFGCTDVTISKMFERDGASKHWMDLCHDDFKLQMHPGNRLEVLQNTFLGNIDRSLAWDRIAGPMIVSSTSDSKTISLWKWCGAVLVDSATRAFFGDAIYRVSPTIVSDFFPFDEEAWKLPYRYPVFAAKTMYTYKRKGEQAFTAYLALPKTSRADASWIVDKMEHGMHKMGITDPAQCAAMLFTLHRLVNSNAYRLCFWCLSHLLFTPSLLATILDEITPAFNRDTNTLDLPYLLDHCPQLASFYEEILRVANDPIGARVVAEKVTVGGKTLLPGRKLLMPYKQLHFNPAVFGSNAGEFDAKRFLNNKGLLRSTSWRPFGGAATHCPGRFLARREVYMFLALVLLRFDVKLAKAGDGKEQRFPRLDESIPSGGVLAPVPGDDVFVEVRERG